jgi:hypothetical protein
MRSKELRSFVGLSEGHCRTAGHHVSPGKVRRCFGYLLRLLINGRESTTGEV